MADKDPFKASDSYQQNTLSRRELIEKSHEAARIMGEMLGQEGQFHAAGAAYGQHSALPLPKTDEKPQEIKFFLRNKKTAAPEATPEPPQPAAAVEQTDYDLGDQEADVPFDDGYGGYYGSDWENSAYPEVEQEELITDILQQRLAFLYMAFQPPEPVEGPADTLFIVSKFKGSGENDRALVRAHSQVLQRYNDAFNELIGYRPPVVPDPDEGEAEDYEMTIVRDEPAERRGSAFEMIQNLGQERQEKWGKAVTEFEEQNQGEEQQLENEWGQPDAYLPQADEEPAQEPSYGARGSVYFKEDEFLQGKRARQSVTFAEPPARRPSQAFTADGLMDLGLESVIGNLQDSHKPLLVKEFLDASENLVKLPGWEHLPPDVKQSFEKFAVSVGKFRNPAADEAAKAVELEYSTLDGGGGLESNFLGMVGRRQSKQMAGILNSISQGVAERKKSTMMIAQAKSDEIRGTGKDVSATAPRTELERRKSAAYLENQEKRKSIAALEPRKSIALIATQDRRISPSFLERRQSKALLATARRESAKFEADDLQARRRTSQAAVAAFERRKRMSVLENASTAELKCGPGFDGGWSGSQKVLPAAKDAGAISAGSLGLVSGTSEVATEGTDARARRIGSVVLDGAARRRSSVGFLERKGSKALLEMKDKERERRASGNAPRPPERRPSRPPPLTSSREQDRPSIVKFYEDEDEDIYATSSSSSAEPEPPPPLPADVQYVIEKRHWTPDILHAILEFIYTEVVHLHCEELPDVYAAANEILLSSLTDAIRLRPVIQYFRLAAVNEYNRVALLNLAKQLTSEADFNNYVNKNADFHDLKRLCEAFSHDGPVEQRPYTLLFETAHVAFRDLPHVTPGLHDINGHMVLILKNPREGTRLFEQHQEQDEYLTFRKKLSDRRNEKPLVPLDWLGQWPPLEKTRNRDKAWKVIFFNFPDLQRDIPLKNYGFYKHVSAITCRPWAPEVFSLRMVVGLLICPVLYDALKKTFPELDIKASRGAGYYMGGETHGNSITLTGQPIFLLQACMACPRHMIGRTVLRVSSPSERTFLKLWTSTNRFGVDLETNVLYFLKPIIQIQKMLEFWFGLDTNACFDVLTSREMVELVEPHDPF
ncbi:hypothetical protein MPTK1_4g08600 [Marchantia polymorpha subsp. ruderalis]|uniref:BTB domain-containing protein n=2 Tax=Marchantia polymorpha TaxID=3197 RepID=A0AAF6B7T5_MARPO|nr:hypothetical protein MARPO_0157s0019 [Marchantia polymorpha]BBN08069.1 hypothetical protein Mp_4g08600 [Marchantia polymorpha subsp. ruderalis]|eukprot:PTQ28687.1 hypothetical protein MARPO_0157s0019 [Marchantia polymorpha]